MRGSQDLVVGFSASKLGLLRRGSQLANQLDEQRGLHTYVVMFEKQSGNRSDTFLGLFWGFAIFVTEIRIHDGQVFHVRLFFFFFHNRVRA